MKGGIPTNKHNSTEKPLLLSWPSCEAKPHSLIPRVLFECFFSAMQGYEHIWSRDHFSDISVTSAIHERYAEQVAAH